VEGSSLVAATAMEPKGMSEEEHDVGIQVGEPLGRVEA